MNIFRVLICKPYMFEEVKLFAQIFCLFVFSYWIKSYLYSIGKSFIKYMICRHFLPACGLFSHSFSRIFWRAEVCSKFNFLFINLLFYGSCFCCILLFGNYNFIYIKLLEVVLQFADFLIFFSMNVSLWLVIIGMSSSSLTLKN